MELGVSHQRVAQIYYGELKRIKSNETSDFELSKYTRRRLLYALEMEIDPSNISPQLVSSRLFNGDLRQLGARVHREASAWIMDHGFNVKDGFYNFRQFDGLWRAHATHWPNGRLVPWAVDRFYQCAALNNELARLFDDRTHFKVRLEDLVTAFQRAPLSALLVAANCASD